MANVHATETFALLVCACVAGVIVIGRETIRRRKLTPEERRLEDEQAKEDLFFW
jgi:hypothetical protein